MAIMLPSYAHIRELRLAVTMRERQLVRPLNRRGATGADVSEIWSGQILFQPMNRAQGNAFAAFLESLDGRVTAFGVPMLAGFATHAGVAATGTMDRPGYQGNGQVTVSVTPVGTAIPVGTLIAFGAIDDANYQVCEVVSAGITGPGQVLDIAPRIRNAIAAGTTVTIGTVNHKLTLADDTLGGWQAGVAATASSIDVIEALA